MNLSRKGIGWSVGRRGFRVGVDSSGRGTTHASIPGTGIGYRKVGARGARGCLVAIGTGAVLLTGVAAVGASLHLAN